MKDVKLKVFQYKTTNKILVTKYFLHRINKIDNNLCEYCQHESETIYHVFVECEKVKMFWDNLKIWLNNNASIRIALENKNILFAYQDNDILKVIFWCWLNITFDANKFYKKELSIDRFITILRFQTEDILLIRIVLLQTSLKTWTPL